MVKLKGEMGLISVDDKPGVSSREVAETFGKQHKDILKVIGNLECSDEFRQRNFAPSYYKNLQNKRQPEFVITRDGFTFLVMAFTGKKAAAFKEAYINAFNCMEEAIKYRISTKLTFPPLTDAIKEAHEEIKPYHFSNELDMINRIVFGMSAKKYCELHGLTDNDQIRDMLTPNEVKLIDKLQASDTVLVELGMDYEERKMKLTQIFSKYSLKLSLNVACIEDEKHGGANNCLTRIETL